MKDGPGDKGLTSKPEKSSVFSGGSSVSGLLVADECWKMLLFMLLLGTDMSKPLAEGHVPTNP